MPRGPGGRGGPPFRPPSRPDGSGPARGRMMLPRPGMRGGGRGGARLPHPGMTVDRGPRGPMPPRGAMPPRGRMGPMRGGREGRGRGRGRPGGRMLVGPRGARGRGRPPPRPGMVMRPAQGRGVSPRPPSPDAATAGAAPSWMSSALKANDDDDDDFAQPVPVSKSTVDAKEESTATPPAASAPATRMPPWAKPYKAASQEAADRPTTKQQGTPAPASGMPKWGQKATPPAPKKETEPRSEYIYMTCYYQVPRLVNIPIRETCELTQHC